MADLDKPYKITERVNGILEKTLNTVEPKFVKQVVEWVGKFQTSSGNLTRSKSNKDRIATFKTAIERHLQRAGYYDMISQFLVGFDEMSAAQTEIQQDLNAISLTKSFLNSFKRVAINDVITNMEKQGLLTSLINPLRNQLNIAVNQGSSLADTVASIRGQLETTEKRQGILKKLSLQSTRDALGQYDGTVNEAVRKTYKLDAILYVGSLVKDSRAQCERWTQYMDNGKRGLILFEQLEQEIMWADANGTGMIPNTTPENFCQNRGGFNCRHVAYPVRNPNKITTAGNVSEKVDPEISKKEQELAINLAKYGNATNVKDAKANTKEIFEKANIPIEKISFSNDLSLEDLNERNKQFYSLSSSYNVSGFEKPITIENKSTKTYYGIVNLVYNRITKKTYVSKANFGDKTDPKTRIQSLEEEKELFSKNRLRGKSRVDEKNNKLATLTHEFAHFTTVTDKIGFDKTAKEFFEELKNIKADYDKEILKVANTDEFFDIFLGNYANYNLDEFLAEGFTEYKLREKPSKYALKIGKLFDKYYKK